MLCLEFREMWMNEALSDCCYDFGIPCRPPLNPWILESVVMMMVMMMVMMKKRSKDGLVYDMMSRSSLSS